MKDKIISGALSQFLKQGIRKITMQNLAQHLAVSTKTLYKYYPNKEDLLEECLRVHYSEIILSINQIFEDSPNEVYSILKFYVKLTDLDFGTNDLFYKDLNYYYPTLQDKITHKYSGQVVRLFTSIIKNGKLEGYFRDDINPSVILQALNVLYASITRNNVYKKNKLSPQALVQQTVNIYIRGMCTEKGLRVFNNFQ